MNTFKKYKKIGINIFGNFEDHEYFCTPKGAIIIGFEGVDGIHYCFIRGFDDMVFAVSPSNRPGDYVYPVARNFGDFLGLIKACKGTAAIEQAHMWDKTVFDDFVEHSEPDTAKLSALEKVAEKLQFEPISDPYFYLKELQSSFDYSKLKFNPDYYEALPDEYLPEPYEWKVYFDEGFWKHRSRSRAGEEVSVGVKFEWADEVWHIPSVYMCSKGIVIDFCIEIDPEKVKSFMDKWLLTLQYDSNIDRATREQIENENPLDIDFLSKIVLNGAEINYKSGSSLNWWPDSCRPEDVENTKESKRIIEHYGLDKSRSWVFFRQSYEYKTKKRPNLSSLGLHLEQRPVSLYGQRFTTPSVGEKVEFSHPLSGQKYVLTVTDYGKQTLDHLPVQDGYEMPKHYNAMTYTLEPDMPDMFFSVRDCLDNEQPRRIKTSREKNLFEPTATYDFVSIGIIGGADGPTAILFSPVGSTLSTHIACSSLRFEPAETVEWQAVFREKTRRDIDLKII